MFLMLQGGLCSICGGIISGKITPQPLKDNGQNGWLKPCWTWARLLLK
jgi:hypothetical protein